MELITFSLPKYYVYTDMKLIRLLLITLLIMPMMAVAQIKIGFVNPQVVMMQLPEAKNIETELAGFIQKKQSELAEKEQAYQIELQAFQEVAKVLSESELNNRQQALLEMQQELQELSNSTQVAIQKKRNDLLGPLMLKITNAISDVAKEHGLDFVFNTGTNTGDSIILFVEESERDKHNITQKVLDKITQS